MAARRRSTPRTPASPSDCHTWDVHSRAGPGTGTGLPSRDQLPNSHGDVQRLGKKQEGKVRQSSNCSAGTGSLQPWMPPDAQAGAGGWMASLNLHSAREMQSIFPVHAAFCLCRGGINPPRCSLGSQALQRFVSERLHCLQLSRGFSQTTLALQQLLISFFPCRVFWALA